MRYSNDKIEITTVRGAEMMRAERENWIVSIENTADFIASEIGSETVDFVLGRYGASSIESISDSDLSEVFGELYAIETDFRSD